MAAAADRRGALRFDIIGGLWATLSAPPSLSLLNLCETGLLVESVRPLSVGSVQRVHLDLGGGTRDVVDAVVKHVTRSRNDCYLVGMAFLDLPSESRLRLDALIQRMRVPGDSREEA